ncbi:MAG TPA: L-threonylcarbamoyladenylate synthase [Jiangellaceae bacterium]
MSPLYDCADAAKRVRGLGAARRAVSAGKLIVLPTDTVYGVGADAFSATAVAALLAAKGRGPDMPVPVLVGAPETLAGIAITNDAVDALVEAFWPGGLTLVCREQPSLRWDLGRTEGTVAVRMPRHDIALELLRETGPLAVSSANVTGQPPARSAAQAREQLGDAVAVYLEAGLTDDDVPSTIVDVTGEVPRVLRAGAVGEDEVRAVVAAARAAQSAADGDSDGESGESSGTGPVAAEEPDAPAGS